MQTALMIMEIVLDFRWGSRRFELRKKKTLTLLWLIKCDDYDQVGLY